MAVVSTAPVYKAALTDALAADTQLDAENVQILYGANPRIVEKETIEVGNIHWPESGWAGLGAQRRDEHYEITVFILVTNEGLTQKEATERAFVLLGRIETVLHANIRMTGVHQSFVEIEDLLEMPSETGFMALVKSKVCVKARK